MKQMKNSEKLLPCPFCGCDVADFPEVSVVRPRCWDAYLKWKVETQKILGADNGYVVRCPKCGAKARYGMSPEEAKKNWNSRGKLWLDLSWHPEKTSVEKMNSVSLPCNADYIGNKDKTVYVTSQKQIIECYIEEIRIQEFAGKIKLVLVCRTLEGCPGKQYQCLPNRSVFFNREDAVKDMKELGVW